jgi:hypothetical protein
LYSDIQGGYGGGTGNINANPQFTDGWIHLSGTSPCIDTGDPQYAAEANETDIDGDIRVKNRVDMGADEFVSSSAALFVIVPGNLQFTAQGKHLGNQMQSILIKNYGTGSLNWQIEMPPDCNWLSVTPLSGQITDGNSVVTISVDPSKADYGTNTAQFTISAPGASNSPQTVTVNLTVSGPSIYFPSPLYIYAGKNTKVEKTFEIRNSGYDILHWNIEAPNDGNWLETVERGMRGREKQDGNNNDRRQRSE